MIKLKEAPCGKGLLCVRLQLRFCWKHKFFGVQLSCQEISFLLIIFLYIFFLYQISKDRGCELMLGFSRPILNINVIYSFGSSFPGCSFKMDKDCEDEYRP